MLRDECANAPLILQSFIQLQTELVEQKYKECFDISSYIHTIAQNSTDITSARICWLIGDLCSMALNPTNRNEPFSANIVLADGRRSAILDDFKEEELSFIEQILSQCQIYQISARIADMLWSLKRGAFIEFVKIAIINYQKYPLQEKNIHNASKAWQRALWLSLIIKQPCETIYETIIAQIQQTTSKENFYLMRLVEILDITKLDQATSEIIIVQLHKVADEFKQAKQYYQSTQYYQCALTWAEKINNQNMRYEFHYEVGYSFYLLALNQPHEFQSTAHYENALQSFRKIPKKMRSKYNVDTLINEIEKKIPETNQVTLEHMQKLETKVDLKDAIAYSEQAVSHQPKFKALYIFVNFIHTLKKNDLKKIVQDSIQQYPIQHLFGSVYINHDGRTISKTPALSTLSKQELDNENILLPHMIQDYQNNIGIIVQGYVIPALFQLLFEHRITKNDMQHICETSTFVPQERTQFWIEGLWYGFEFNFLVALHLLIPQIEHVIRQQLKVREVKTTTIDQNCIETEKGLSTLLEMEEAKSFLNENLLFELQALLTQAQGPNFRNNIAHGLSETGELNSYNSAYVWWLCLKLVINNNSFDFSQE
jgi:tetratricopeptide (TPR) repeat protein